MLEKIELLEAKHSQSLADNLKKLLEGFVKFNQEAIAKFEMTKGLFPIEVDLKSDAFTYKSQSTFSSDGIEEEIPQAVEAEESLMQESLSQGLLSLMSIDNNNDSKTSILDLSTNRSEGARENLLLCELGLNDIELGTATENNKIPSIDDLLN